MSFQFPGSSFSFADGKEPSGQDYTLRDTSVAHEIVPLAVRQVAKQVGEFYLEECCEDYDEAAFELLRLQITNIDVTEDTVTITTNRPGMFIGKRGEKLDKLEKHLLKKVKIVECKDNIYNYLIPIEEQDEDEGSCYDPYEYRDYDEDRFHSDLKGPGDDD